jgi:putative membrane protein insertion efficiency factor
VRNKLTARLGEVLSAFLIASVRLYQVGMRPLLPAVCRFQPSCSEYFIEAVRKYGPMRGAYKGIGRICRCNPWYPGGYDPP